MSALEWRCLFTVSHCRRSTNQIPHWGGPPLLPLLPCSGINVEVHEQRKGKTLGLPSEMEQQLLVSRGFLLGNWIYHFRLNWTSKRSEESPQNMYMRTRPRSWSIINQSHLPICINTDGEFSAFEKDLTVCVSLKVNQIQTIACNCAWEQESVVNCFKYCSSINLRKSCFKGIRWLLVEIDEINENAHLGRCSQCLHPDRLMPGHLS